MQYLNMEHSDEEHSDEEHSDEGYSDENGLVVLDKDTRKVCANLSQTIFGTYSQDSFGSKSR